MAANRNPGETDSRKVICCLLVLEIADYESKPVFDQIRLTQHLRQVLSDTTAHAGPDDVVSIVREQGAVLSFLADPEECFTTALAIREAMLNQHCYRDLLLRIGINLGSVEIARDEFGHAYVSGPGRRDAERAMHQGPPRQVSITRPFFEVLSRAAPELAGALEYRGVFSDTLGPPLGLYRLAASQSGDAPSPVMMNSPTADRSAQPTRALSPTAPRLSMRPAQSAADESRRARRWRLRYALVALLLGAAALTSSSRFRIEVAALMPAPQLAAAVTESPTPRAGVEDSAISATTPDTMASVQQLPAARPESAVEKPARRVSRLARRGPDPAHASARTARLEPSREQETKVDRTAGRARPAPASDSATLLLAVKPWGEVYVDGTKVGVTPPLKRFQVAPGRRLITIKNSSLPEYRVQLSVDPEAQVTIAHDFSCTSDRERRCWEEISKGLAPQSRLRFKTVEAEPQTELR
jgi:hypothetical protein